MKVLTTTAQVNKEISRLIRGCASCQLAVAWASVGFDAFDLLAQFSTKIEKMIVGTHFFQTHPAFIEKFLTHTKVRFVKNTDGVFHPKVYFFENAEGDWECLVGSPNFTKGGFCQNAEVAMLMTNLDRGAQEALSGIKALINAYWQNASRFSRPALKAYRKAWKWKQPMLRSLQGKFGNPQEDESDNGKTPFDIPVLQMTWFDFFKTVQAETITPHGHIMKARLQVIQTAKRLFETHKHFNKIDKQERRKIAGLLTTPNVDYRLFGSMIPTWQFKDAVVSDDERLDRLSLALDVIPVAGAISRDTYLKYTKRFVKAFPGGGAGLATATRLLAMKRPDYFVCIDKKNEQQICKEFHVTIKAPYKYEQYWDSIIVRIMEAMWWSSPAPHPGVERDVWEARVAFLDSHYYKG